MAGCLPARQSWTTLWTGFGEHSGDEACCGELPIVEVLLAIDQPSIHVDVEDTASSLNQRKIRRWKSRFDFCFHPGSMGFIVSDDAVGDTDFHRGLLLSEYPMIENPISSLQGRRKTP